MEYKILSESLVYYACKNPKTGELKPGRDYEYESNLYLGNKTKLYKHKKTAEEYGLDNKYTELVKIKLVEIE